MELCGRRIFSLPVLLILVIAFVWIPKGVCGVEARTESQLETCCSFGVSWASEGLRCENFTAAVSDVVDHGLCLEKQRNCCEGCKLGILMGSLGQNCAFKRLSFGKSWDSSFLECCHNASPTTKNTKLGTSSTSISSESTESFNRNPEERCKKNNLCEQFCNDTGSEVMCSCEAGFTLGEDGYSCSPVLARIDLPIDADIKHEKPKCPAGYHYNETTQVCDDIDECTEGLHSCGDKVCNNDPGSYSCVRVPVPILERPRRQVLRDQASTSQPCQPEMKYVKNRGCIDIKKCEEDPDACTSNEKCIKTPGSSPCKCDIGFRFDNLTQACIDINECQLLESDCSETERCENTFGSYRCVRHMSCGTGYTLNADTSVCEDDDECIMGTHDCRVGYHCRNTLGSYRCYKDSGVKSDPQDMPVTSKIMLTTPIASAIQSRPRRCPQGFEVEKNGQCLDVNECQRSPNPCAGSSLQDCVNTMGSFGCVSRERCGNGYVLDPVSGSRCIDIDECAENTHECGTGQTCQNRLGGYDCKCPVGYVLGPYKQCVDVDECNIDINQQNYESICGQNSHCENTVGSYRCVCNTGFTNVAIGHGPCVCEDVDECRKIPGLCQHDCTNVWGSYTCSCKPGYRLNSDKRSCTDINECEEFKENNPCNGICVNTLGSYACSCPDGFKLDVSQKTCQDIDECASGEACQDSSELCQNTHGSFRCHRIDCPVGYNRDRESKRCVARGLCGNGYVLDPVNGSQCIDIDECAENIHECGTDQTCQNRQGGYDCECPAGYALGHYKQCVDVDECKIDINHQKYESICGQNSRCENTVGSYRCVCNAGFENVATDNDPGVCEDVDECQQTPGLCQHDCTNAWGSYICSCKPGFRLNPDKRSCTEECRFKKNSPCIEVSCPAGYKFDADLRSCQDIDECASGRACRDPSEICQNTHGSFRCNKIDCPVGYYTDGESKKCVPRVPCGDGFVLDPVSGSRCIDIDECADNTHECGAGQICQNRQGGYDCECPVGYVVGPNDQCVDVDECSTYARENYKSICEQNSHCENTLGSYHCVCDAGFANVATGYGPDVCEDVDECQQTPGLCQHDCTNAWGSYTCSCKPGYRLHSDKRSCTDIDECEDFKKNNLCSDICFNTPGSYICSCPAGYKLDVDQRTCQDIDECASGRACRDPSEMCQNTHGSFRCNKIDCPFGYYRDRESTKCVPRVLCGNGYVLDPVSGSRCIDIDECADNTHKCRTGQICKNRQGGYDCECPVGFAAGPDEHCVDVDECRIYGKENYKSICGQNSRCENTAGSYRCVCDAGFATVVQSHGSSVCEDVDECQQIPGLCQHDCTNAWGSYTCSCKPGYRLNSDKRSCTDIDECEEFKKNNFCSDICLNTPGSYICSCPAGYKLDVDQRTCQDIDECASGRACRDPSEMCQNTHGSFRCNKIDCPVGYYRDRESKKCVPRVLCGNGYVLDPVSGSRCIDIDECADNTHKCRTGQICKNRQGGYYCECPVGYAAGPDEHCVDVDECRIYGKENYISICGQNSRCENTVGSYRCVCDAGFATVVQSHGSSVCEDVDECKKTPGLCQHDCINAWGSYRCSCKPGYRLNSDKSSCSDINECEEFKKNNLCSGICVNTLGSYTCSCPAGYRLDVDHRTCQDIDECASGRACRDPSEVCQNTHGSFRCNKMDCPVGYYIDRESKRCVSRVLCGNGYILDPVSGSRCIDIDECADNTHECATGQTCRNSPGSYICDCPAGHMIGHDKQCVDVDECSIYPGQNYRGICGQNSHCENTVGSYRCVCDAGFANVVHGHSSGVCEDVDECRKTPGLCQHDCLNTWGSYRCSCKPGYRLNSDKRSCTDVDECEEFKNNNLCSDICVNTPGSYTCRCPAGYKLDVDHRTCQDIDECASGWACRDPSERCENSRGSFRCNKIDVAGNYEKKDCVLTVLCGNGYVLDPAGGDRCIDVDECADNTHKCGTGQTCRNRQGGYACECPAGHVFGPDKQCVDVDECTIYAGQNYGRVCGQNGRCENTVGSYRCICDAGFANTAIGHSLSVCEDVDECQKTPGLCHHDCINIWGSYMCSCKPGYRLSPDKRSCTDIDECEEFKKNNPCIGFCENTPGSYTCSCPAGYTLHVNQRICRDIDECASGHACRDPSEMCQNTHGGFRCNKIDCPVGYQRDDMSKGRCVRTSRYCPVTDLACLRQPSHISYTYMTLVSMVPIPESGQMKLFTISSEHIGDTTPQFRMELVDVRASTGVVRANEDCFALRRPAPSQAVLVLTRSIAGPQEIEIDFNIDMYYGTVFAGNAVAKLFISVSQYEF